MHYLQEVFFTNLNIVHRDGSFFSAGRDTVWEMQPLAFDQNKFYYITKGACSITIGETTYTATAGMWFFIPAGTVHSYHRLPGSPLEKYWIHFDLYPDANIFHVLGLPYFVSTRGTSAADALFNSYMENKKGERLLDKIEEKALLFLLLKEYIQLSKAHEKVLTPKVQDALSDVLSYINKRLKNPLSNAELAGICHMHPNHFIRYFKSKTGQTPHTYITQKRMEAAKRLLEKTDLPLSEIAEEVGMWDIAHLTKVFRRFYATTPKAYRKKWEADAGK